MVTVLLRSFVYTCLKIWDIGGMAADIGAMTKDAKEISMRNTHLRRFIALLMVLLMTCASASAATVKAGETISSTSRWINSDIEGAVDETTNVSVKDDFHGSLGTDTGVLLMAPGKNDKDNLRFITFVVNTLAAIYRHNGLLKASIMSAANAHRLGAAEAPPAIISSFLGSHLSSVLDHMETTDDVVKILSKRELRLNIPALPELMIDNTDRNRTSPFAFTGNRFEFRAVGSEANCASAMIALNTAMAEQLTIFKHEVDTLIDKGMAKEDALVKILRKYIKYSKPVRFDGNGYSDEWRREASRRGLDCEASAPIVFDRYLDKESVDMFRKMDVMTETELRARNEIKWEMYTKKIQIEARVLGDLALNHIVPTATKYQSSLLDNVIKMEQVIGKEEGDRLSAENIELVKEMAQHVAEIRRLVTELVERRKVANRIASERDKAIAYHDTVAPMLEEIRSHIDDLELVVDNELWTLPKYRELLFIV